MHMHRWPLMHSMHTVGMDIEIFDYNIVIVFNLSVMIYSVHRPRAIKDFRLMNTFQTIKLLEVLLIMLIHKCI